MSEKQIHILAFDVYGTLYNTDSIANDIEKHLSITSDKAKEVSLLWRRYQLESVLNYISHNLHSV